MAARRGPLPPRRGRAGRARRRPRRHPGPVRGVRRRREHRRRRARLPRLPRRGRHHRPAHPRRRAGLGRRGRPADRPRPRQPPSSSRWRPASPPSRSGWPAVPRPRVLVLEWTDPPFAPGHWIPEMVTRAGGEPTIGVAGTRSCADHVGRGGRLASRRRGVRAVRLRPRGARRWRTTYATASRGVPVWAVDADGLFARPGAAAGRRRRGAGRDPAPGPGQPSPHCRQV